MQTLKRDLIIEKEVKMCVHLLALAIQDLKLEKHFLDLNPYYTLRKARYTLEANTASALDWITSPDDSYMFSFQSVCELLGIEPQTLKSKLLELASENDKIASAYNNWINDNGKNKGKDKSKGKRKGKRK